MRFGSWTGALAGLACMLLLAGSALAQGGELVRAEWGVPGRLVDVTARVRTFERDGVLQFEVTRFSLGIDPAPHVNKVLVLHIRHWDGGIKDYNYPERSSVNLELDPEGGYDRDYHPRDDRREDDHDRHDRGLRILRAYYGAGGQFVNVTDALRGRIDDGRLLIRVDNDNLGGDPLPGVHKQLSVLYVLNGDRRNIVVDEKTDLRLP